MKNYTQSILSQSHINACTLRNVTIEFEKCQCDSISLLFFDQRARVFMRVQCQKLSLEIGVFSMYMP